MATKYAVKWVCDSRGRSIPIALQGANGPCALLALLNVQFQRGALDLPRGTVAVTETSAMTLLAELAMRGAQTFKGSPEAMAARENAVQHFVELLPSLKSGMHVNVRFSAPTAFEYTKEISAFDCFPDIRLVHGWLVDPQDTRLASAFGKLSYNQVMDELVRLSEPTDLRNQRTCPTHHPPPPPPLHAYPQEPASAHVSQHPPAYAPHTYAPPATSHQTPAADASLAPTMYFEDWAEDDGSHGPSASAPAITPATSATAPLLTPVRSLSAPVALQSEPPIGPADEDGDIDIQLPPHLRASAPPMEPTDTPYSSSREDDELSASIGDLGISSPEQEKARTSDLSTHAALVIDFFDSFPTQLTYHGIVELHALLRNGDTCILFRNSHFYVLRKHASDLYTLVTDVGFEKEPDIAWELLSDVNGDSSFYSAVFTPSVPVRDRSSPVTPPNSAPLLQTPPPPPPSRPPQPRRSSRAQRHPCPAASSSSSRRKQHQREDCCIQ